ncbi:hypothetical protein PIB30_065724 [Stylosanthes scabra]|uniref:RRM domain-containing protein n=1 Tax=Stylosanthes scabra TaxID=79078 RepID=A0ABU6QLL2_9FABA|nr:hypothetical protein [Stylosanthes scabra]
MDPTPSSLTTFHRRKKRRNSNSLFAFIRFHAYGAAFRAINRLNGKLWYEAKLYVALSKYGRKTNKDTIKPSTKTVPIPKQIWVPKEAVANKRDQLDNVRSERPIVSRSDLSDQKKVIQVVWVEDDKMRCKEACWVFALDQLNLERLCTTYLRNGRDLVESNLGTLVPTDAC